jgi:hypothetical protein
MGFPILALSHNLSAVKRLAFKFSWHNSEEKKVFLPHLEKLGMGNPGIELVAPKLQRLVFSNFTLSSDATSSMQQLINASGSSLQRLRFRLAYPAPYHELELRKSFFKL